MEAAVNNPEDFSEDRGVQKPGKLEHQVAVASDSPEERESPGELSFGDARALGPRRLSYQGANSVTGPETDLFSVP